MTVLTRFTAFTKAQAAVLNSYADEIERIAAGVFSSTTSTAKPIAKVRRTSTQAVASSTFTTITWQQAVRDSDGMWDPGTPDRLTFVTPGAWLLVGCPRFASTSGQKRIYLTKNGTTIPDPGSNVIGITDSAAGSSIIQVSLPDVFAAGDQVYARAYQDSGGSVNLDVDVGGTYLSAYWLGP